MPALWRKYSGFKIEADCERKGRREIGIADDARGQGADQASGRRQGPDREPVHRRTTPVPAQHGEQEDRLLEGRRDGADAAWRWKYSRSGLPGRSPASCGSARMDAELFEVSIKAPVVQAAAATAGFMAFLAEVGAERDDGQQAKTRWALEHAAKQHREAKTARAGE